MLQIGLEVQQVLLQLQQQGSLSIQNVTLDVPCSEATDSKVSEYD
jgi:hypothetical protein